MKIKLEGTIPTTAYGNLRPTFEVDTEEELELAHQAMSKMWNRFGETPLKDKQSGGVEVESFTGEKLIWNEETHTYTDLQGHVLLSGSAYANNNSPKFDLEMMLPKTATAWEIPVEDLRSIWKFNGDIANHWGSAVHVALELYHKYNKLGAKIQEKKKLDINYVTPKNSYLRKIVQEFIDLAGTDALCEVLVSDVANKMAGTIDRLVVTGDKTCRVQDYKTNNELDNKKLLKYQKQMSFYAHILMNKGWKVDGLDLYYLNADDGWSLKTLDILELE